MITTPQAALLSYDEIVDVWNNAPIHPDENPFLSRMRAVEQAILAKLQATQADHVPETGKMMATQAEPAQAGELPPLPILGAVHTEIDGKVHLYPTAYKRLILEWWERGARAALATQTKQAGELPPLPDRVNLCGGEVYGYSAAQMHAYARAALAARKPLTMLDHDQVIRAMTESFPTPSLVPMLKGSVICGDFHKALVSAVNVGIEEFCRINGLEVKP